MGPKRGGVGRQVRARRTRSSTRPLKQRAAMSDTWCMTARGAVRTTFVLLLALVALAGRADIPNADAAPAVRGVAVDIFLHEHPSLVLKDIDAAAHLGSTTVRVALDWSGFEPYKPQEYAQWYLDRLDALVSHARSRGLRVVLTPVFTPGWATSGGPTSPPTDPKDYARFLAFLAGRYAADLAGIEVWNEPNHGGFWSAPDPAAAYAKLLAAAYPAVKTAAPAVPVVGGVLAGVDVAFLDRLYAAGIANNFDVLSVHPYNDGRAPDTLIDPRWAHVTFLQGLRALRTSLDARGEQRPVWATEMGWNTSTQRGELWLDGVSLSDQATYLARAFELLDDPASGVSYVSGALVYRLRDVGSDPANPQHNYGLQYLDGTAKPSYDAVRSAWPATSPPPDEPVGTEPEPTPDEPVGTEPEPTPDQPVSTEPEPSAPGPPGRKAPPGRTK